MPIQSYKMCEGVGRRYDDSRAPVPSLQYKGKWCVKPRPTQGIKEKFRGGEGMHTRAESGRMECEREKAFSQRRHVVE
jgi:hypothetical protein